MSKENFQNEFLDLISELGNITFGTASTALSVIVNQNIDISTPKVEIISREVLFSSFSSPYVLVEIEYAEGLEGHNVLMLKPKDAAIIADLMMGGEGTNPNTELGEFELSAVQEAMNMMMGSASTSMSEFLNKAIDINPPNTVFVESDTDKTLENLFPDKRLIIVRFELKIGNLVHSNIMQIINIPFAKQIASELLGI